MKAIICTKYGPPEVLKLQDVKKPVPKDKEILIKIYVTTVSSGDCRIRGFNVPKLFWLPGRLALGITKPRNSILGVHFSGVVEEIGKDVNSFKIGDKVFGYTGFKFGTYAEYVTMPESGSVTIKPSNMSHEEAVAIPFGGDTALFFLRKGNIDKNKKVLIYGASGAVGTYAIQIAKYFEAEVTGICSTKNLELVKSLGANKVIDYTKEDFTKLGEKYDIILDAVGKISKSKCKNSLKADGKFLTVLGLDTATSLVKDLIFLRELAQKGIIKPIIDKTYPLENMVEAHRYVDTGHKVGNVVITVIPEI